MKILDYIIIIISISYSSRIIKTKACHKMHKNSFFIINISMQHQGMSCHICLFLNIFQQKTKGYLLFSTFWIFLWKYFMVFFPWILLGISWSLAFHLSRKLNQFPFYCVLYFHNRNWDQKMHLKVLQKVSWR